MRIFYFLKFAQKLFLARKKTLFLLFYWKDSLHVNFFMYIINQQQQTRAMLMVFEKPTQLVHVFFFQIALEILIFGGDEHGCRPLNFHSSLIHFSQLTSTIFPTLLVQCRPKCQHGVCLNNSTKNYKCRCDIGWEGKHCDKANGGKY